jgi:uncharacterized protein
MPGAARLIALVRANEEPLPELARQTLVELADMIEATQARIAAFDARLKQLRSADPPPDVRRGKTEVMRGQGYAMAGVDYFRIQTGSLNDHSIGGGLLNRPIPGPRSWVHYVLVDAIDETIGRVQSLGGKLLRLKAAVPKTAWYAVVEDPQGNIFAVYQHDATAMPMPEPEV